MTPTPKTSQCGLSRQELLQEVSTHTCPWLHARAGPKNAQRLLLLPLCCLQVPAKRHAGRQCRERIGLENVPGLVLLRCLRQRRRWDGEQGLLLLLLGWLQLRAEALELGLLRAGEPWRAKARLLLLLLLGMLRDSLQRRLRTLLLLLPAQLCFKLVHSHCALLAEHRPSGSACTSHSIRQSMHITPRHPMVLGGAAASSTHGSLARHMFLMDMRALVCGRVSVAAEVAVATARHRQAAACAAAVHQQISLARAWKGMPPMAACPAAITADPSVLVHGAVLFLPNDLDMEV